MTPSGPMGILRRKRRDVDLGSLLLQGHDMLEQTAKAHRSRWGLGDAATWKVDLETATISWSFDDFVATAPVQVIGSHSTVVDEWAWAWAIPTLPHHVRSAVETVREIGVAGGHPALSTARLPVDEAGATDLMAIAFRLTESTGFYRGPGSSSTYFTFEDVTLTQADGSSEVFRVAVA